MLNFFLEHNGFISELFIFNGFGYQCTVIYPCFYVHELRKFNSAAKFIFFDELNNTGATGFCSINFLPVSSIYCRNLILMYC